MSLKGINIIMATVMYFNITATVIYLDKTATVITKSKKYIYNVLYCHCGSDSIKLRDKKLHVVVSGQ